jgi:hypothetical protein
MNKLLLDELMNLAGLAARGEAIDMASLERLKALAVPSVPRKGSGRPKGRRTWGDAPAVERAREFLRLQVVDGLKPSQAARQVAKSWDKDEHHIYKEFARHRERLSDEIDRGIADATESLLKHLDAAIPALVDRMLTAIVGERDEARIRELLIDAFCHWGGVFCEPSNRPIETLSDFADDVARSTFCKALLTSLVD